eukprot:994936_1
MFEVEKTSEQHTCEMETERERDANQEIDPMCCCGCVRLRRGIILLSVILILASVLFIVFSAFFIALIPYWVFVGGISGAIGGLFGLIGACCRSVKSTFLFEIWAIVTLIWWAIFIALTVGDSMEGFDLDYVWDIVWSTGLFVCTAYCLFIIHTYYAIIRPTGSKWWPYSKKEQTNVDSPTQPLTTKT